MITVRRPQSLNDTGGPRSARVRHLGPGEVDPFDEVVLLNDDTIAPGTASPTHGHRAIESLTYVVEGSYVNVDREGRLTLARDGSLLVLTFADGDVHSDANPDTGQRARVIHVWMLPKEGRSRGSHVEQGRVDWTLADNRWLPIAARGDAAGTTGAGEPSIRVTQNIRISVVRLEAPAAVSHRFLSHAIGYVLVIEGVVHLSTDDDAAEVDQGGGVLLVDETGFSLRARTPWARAMLVETLDAT